MTWRTAKAEAVRLADEISRTHGIPEAIELTIYASEESYRRHKPNEPWPLQFHTQVVRAVQRDLLRRKFSVNLLVI